MMLDGEAYSRRLESFSDSTIQLMVDLMAYTRDIDIKMTDLSAEDSLTEEQLVEKLLELKELAEQQKGT